VQSNLVLSLAKGTLARRNYMSDQTMNKSAVTEQNRARVMEMELPSSTSTPEELLRRIATLLFVLVAGLLTAFAYYASSICITVVLAAFLAILFDPVVAILEKLHLPRGVAAAVVVLARRLEAAARGCGGRGRYANSIGERARIKVYRGCAAEHGPSHCHGQSCLEPKNVAKMFVEEA